MWGGNPSFRTKTTSNLSHVVFVYSLLVSSASWRKGGVSCYKTYTSVLRLAKKSSCQNHETLLDACNLINCRANECKAVDPQTDIKFHHEGLASIVLVMPIKLRTYR